MSIMLVNGKFLISAIFLTFLTTTMETTTEIPNQDSSFGCINTELTPKGDFLVPPYNRVCSGEIVPLQCKPQNPLYSTLLWIVRNLMKTIYISNKENIQLPCDDYVVECVYTNESNSLFTSGKFNISKFRRKDPQNILCINKEKIHFILWIRGMNTTLYINDERASSEDLHIHDNFFYLTCSPRLNNSNILLETRLPGGTARHLVARLTVLEASNMNASNKECHQLQTMAIILLSILVGLLLGIAIISFSIGGGIYYQVKKKDSANVM